MKKIMVLIIALILALSAMPVSAAESIPMEVANPDIEVLTSFASCPINGCGGTVVMECGGSMLSDTTRAFTCNYYEHNLYEVCNHTKVIYINSGYCNMCHAPVSMLVNYYGFTNGTHTHSYKHVYSTGNGAYRTQYDPACYV